MKYIIILLFPAFIFAQSEFSSFINYVYSKPDALQKNAAIDSFMVYARSRGIPFIEGNTANFIYRGNKNVLQIAGDFTDWSPSVQMLKVSGTNFFYYSKDFELNARLDYKFVADGSWILDPENPHKVYGGFGPNSELAMPEYNQPVEIVYNPAILHGTLKYLSISSSIASANYSYVVYLPPGYDSLSVSGYTTAYFQDGNEYVNLGSTPTILDNLINQNRIQPIVAVFVQPNNREIEYQGAKRNEYRLFFVNELVPRIDSLFNTSKTAEDRIVIGDSWGGNISALICYNHPDIFEKCGLHSGAFWPNDYEAYNLIVNGEQKNIDFVSVWGTYESLFTNLRDFRDILIAKGYTFEWMELPEGHSWGLWRATTDFMLEHFVPGTSVSVNESGEITNNSFVLYQNYPNPFNPSTEITFSVSRSAHVLIKAYNSIGSEIAVLVNKEYSPGTYKINFNGINLSSGVYYYRMYLDNSSITRKMILLK